MPYSAKGISGRLFPPTFIICMKHNCWSQDKWFTTYEDTRLPLSEPEHSKTEGKRQQASWSKQSSAMWRCRSYNSYGIGKWINCEKIILRGENWHTLIFLLSDLVVEMNWSQKYFLWSPRTRPPTLLLARNPPPNVHIPTAFSLQTL